MTEWTQEREQKILRRSKWVLTIKIIRILFILVCCFIGYMLAISIVSDGRGTNYEDAYFVSVATSMKNPNVYLADVHLDNDTINAIGTRKFSSPLMKLVGQEEIVLGEVNVSKSLLNSYSAIQYIHPGRSELNKFSFTVPNEFTQDENAEDDTSKAVWQQLEKLPEGTVSELKFTTNELMTPEDLLEKLASYDLDVLWMPLVTGEFTSFTPTSYSGSVQMVNIDDKIGLYGGDGHGSDDNKKDFRSGMSIYRLHLDTIEQSKQLLLDNLKEMLEKKNSYQEWFLGISYLQERYDFLTDNGFQIYGAVVTGPTKELLKLRQESGIYQIQLGDVELWNWE